MTKGYASILAVGISLLSSPAFSQAGSATFNQQFEEGSKLMEEKLFNQAAEVWDKLVQEQPENGNLNYKLGLSYFNSYNQKEKALPYLQKASDKRQNNGGSFNTSGYDPFDPATTNPPMEVDYYLGKSYHLAGDLDQADKYYQKFIDEAPKDHDLNAAAVRGKAQTTNARAMMADAKKYEVSNLGGVINGDHPDFSPVLSADGNQLFFTSRRERDTLNPVIDVVAGLPYENIYVSYKDRNGAWQTPEPLTFTRTNADAPLLNVAGAHMASVNVSADGQTLFMYRDDARDGNLYQSKLVGELWSDPELIGSDVNTKSWETHCALAADGNTLYFVSDRKGGSGGRDIYRVVKLPNGEWSKSQNLGNVVNTPYDEDGVFIHPNGRTLYFSSTGHNSMGGFDVFRTDMGEDGNWGKPENIGYPLNTVDDEVFFVTTADGRRGYFSSDKTGGYGEKDIYFVDFPQEMEAEGLAVLKGFIVPPPGQPLPPSTVLYVTDKATGEVRTYKPRQRDGVYVVILQPCKEYNLDYRVEDKTIHTEDIFVECETAYQEINKEIYLNPVALAGPASILDLPKGSPPGSKEKGEKPVKPLTDKDLAEMGKTHKMPNAQYADEYAKYYAYNAKDIDQADQEWKEFVDTVVKLVTDSGTVKVVIEASASHVPTKTYGTNDVLSTKRMEDARTRLIEAVTARGVDPNKLLLEAVNHLVQGPKYSGDYQNTEKYGKFQYVKLKVR